MIQHSDEGPMCDEGPKFDCWCFSREYSSSTDSLWYFCVNWAGLAFRRVAGTSRAHTIQRSWCYLPASLISSCVLDISLVPFYNRLLPLDQSPRTIAKHEPLSDHRIALSHVPVLSRDSKARYKITRTAKSIFLCSKRRNVRNEGDNLGKQWNRVLFKRCLDFDGQFSVVRQYKYARYFQK